MRFTIDGNHKHFFSTNGWVEFEGLLKEEEVQELENPTMGRLQRLFRRRQLGEIAFALTDRRPLRIASFQHELLFPDIAGPLWGLLFPLSGEKRGHGIFFTQESAESLYLEPNTCYLLVVLTENYLDATHHPFVFR